MMTPVHYPWIASAVILAASYMSPAGGALPAFPGAEGFGAQTPGGRGGRIIKVTNLNSSGAGSLEAACRTPGPRIVIFEVSGIIRADVVISEPYITIAGQTESPPTVEAVPGAKKIAWKYPSQEPVWAAVLTGNVDAAEFVGFAGGPTGHRLWSQSKAGFTITSGRTHAEAFEWVVEHRVKHTYPLTAMRMLDECGGVTEGICIDIGCGTGNLDIELAKRSNLKIIGPEVPEAAHRWQGGPGMLAGRIIADYGITEGKSLVICPNDAGGTQALQNGLAEMSNLKIIALYPSEKVAGAAAKRIRRAGLSNRITCKAGALTPCRLRRPLSIWLSASGPY